MKRSLILFFSLLMSYKYLICQLSPADVNPPPLNKPFNFDQNIAITTFDGRPFQGDMSGIDGSPYFFDDFAMATVTLNNGQKYDSVSMKLNEVSHEIIILTDKEAKYMVLKKGLIKEFVFNDVSKVSVNKIKFRCNYAPVDNNDQNIYYQVLTDGKLQLLKCERKVYKETKDIMSGEIKKEFTGNKFLYFCKNGELTKFKKDKDSILGLMDDKSKAIDAWLEKNKVNFKNPDDIQKLVAYYNTL